MNIKEIILGKPLQLTFVENVQFSLKNRTPYYNNIYEKITGELKLELDARLSDRLLTLLLPRLNFHVENAINESTNNNAW